MNLWALRSLRWAYVAFIAAASAAAIQSGLRGAGEGSHSGHFVLALAIPELVAALAFLVEPLEVVACGVLLVVYVVAGAVSLASGDYLAPLRFLYFAATAVLIVSAQRHRPAARA
jgi:hypothetical protein